MAKKKYMKYMHETNVITSVLGAGVGVFTPYLVESLAEGVVPLPLPPPYNKNSVFYPLIGGAVATVGSFFVPNGKIAALLLGFGVGSLTTVAAKIILPSVPPAARFRAPIRPQLQRQMQRPLPQIRRASGGVIKGRVISKEEAFAKYPTDGRPVSGRVPPPTGATPTFVPKTGIANTIIA